MSAEEFRSKIILLVIVYARGEKAPSNPTEIIKDPMILEFLGLK